jgi:FixJ family two-component response regulator
MVEHLVAGRANKVIASEFDISPTVEIHRAHVMEKMQADSLSDLIQLRSRRASKEAAREASLFGRRSFGSR